jgi:hypothetical protein
MNTQTLVATPSLSGDNSAILNFETSREWDFTFEPTASGQVALWVSSPYFPTISYLISVFCDEFEGLSGFASYLNQGEFYPNYDGTFSRIVYVDGFRCSEVLSEFGSEIE